MRWPGAAQVNLDLPDVPAGQIPDFDAHGLIFQEGLFVPVQDDDFIGVDFLMVYHAVQGRGDEFRARFQFPLNIFQVNVVVFE